MNSSTIFWGSQARSANSGTKLATSLLRVVDTGLCGVIFIAPYFFGGRHDLGRLVFVSIVAITAIAWFVRQTILPLALWPRSAAHIVLILAAAVVVLQIVPLSADLLLRLSPRTAELLPLWAANGAGPAHLGTWQSISLAPHETTKALAMLLSYSLLFLVVIARIQDQSDVKRLLNWIGSSAALMAVLGLLQYATSDGCYLWFYEHAYRSTKDGLAGPFINRNHFADFLVMGLGPLLRFLPLANRKSTAPSERSASPNELKQRLTIWLFSAAATVVVMTIFLSRSRGGAVALLVAGIVFVVIHAARGLADIRLIYGLAALAIIVGGLLSIHGADQIAERLDDFTEGSLDKIDHNGIRRTLWTANVDAFRAGWLTGAGVGCHSEFCQVYLPQYFTKEYTHAENGYLQVASETGIGGVILLITGLGFVVTWCITALRKTTDAIGIRLLAATSAGLAASVVHSVVDFVWYVPACMSLIVILAGCALRLAQMSLHPAKLNPRVFALKRARWLELTFAVTVIGIWCIHTYIGPGIAAVYWDRYLRASVAQSESERLQTTLPASNGADSSSTAQSDLNSRMIRELGQVVHWDPQFARAHLKLAVRYLAQFDLEQQRAANAISLSSICDTIGRSTFASQSDLTEWLERAVGPHLRWLRMAAAEARTAVELCPLQGEGYMHLAYLALLNGERPQTTAAYADQALRVRPHNAEILFEIGRQELANNHLELALKYWQSCFDDPGPHQSKIVAILAGRIPAATFVSTFEPNWPLLRSIWNRYREIGTPADITALLAYSTERTQATVSDKGGVPAAFIWYWQAQLHQEAGQAEDALSCLQRAYECDPRQYTIRFMLAKTLHSSGHFAEAEPHYRWCLARRPGDKSLSAALIAISKTRLAQRSAQKQTSTEARTNNNVTSAVYQAPVGVQRTQTEATHPYK